MRYFFTLICLVDVLFLFSQSFYEKNILPKVKSPNVTAMSRFGTYDVSSFTGVPDISIPIFTIEEEDIKIPLELKYHASGIKVQDEASWVGLGWSLSTGGNLSRSIKGGPDDFKILNGVTDIPSIIDANTQSGYLFLQPHIPIGDQVYPSTDSRPDIFQYNFLNSKGHFLYKNKNVPIFYPEEPYKIEAIGAPFGKLNGFKLSNDKGIDFYFGSEGNINNITVEKSWVNQQNQVDIITWNLKKIRSKVSGKKVIYNYYPEKNLSTPRFFNDYINVTDAITAHSTQGYDVPVQPSVLEYSMPIAAGRTQNLLKEILFSNGKIEFIISSTTLTEINTDFLSEIKVFNLINGQYNLIKKIKFNYSYFDGNNNTKRLKLMSVSFAGSDTNTNSLSYKFDYNENLPLPEYGSKSMDLWGYFNNKYNTTLVPRQIIYTYNAVSNHTTPVIQTIGGSIGGRDVDDDAIQTGVLKKITYPSGGYTKFEYEVNRYQQGGVEYKGGGIRIKNIKSYNFDNNYISGKKYHYGVSLGDTSGVGYVNSISQIRSKPYKRKVAYYVWPLGTLSSILGYSWNVTNYGSNMTADDNDFETTNVYYPYTEEIELDSVNNKLGKTALAHTYLPDQINTVFLSSRPVVESKHYKRGLPTKKLIYNSYDSLVQSTDFFYSDVNYRREETIGLYVDEKVVITGKSSESDGYNASQDLLPYTFSKYGIDRGAYKLTGQIDKYFTKLGGTESSQQFNYNKSGHLSSEKKIDSKNNEFITSYKYATDYFILNTNNSVLAALLDSNFIYNPIEIIYGYDKNGTTAIKSGFFYKFSHNLLIESIHKIESNLLINNFQYSSISAAGEFIKDYRYNKFISINKYNDQRKMIESTKLEETARSYIWDSKGSNLIAEVIGAQSGSTITNNSSYTGALSLNLQGGQTANSNFVVGYSGNIVLELNRGTFLSSNTTTYINYNINGPIIRSGSLCMNNEVGSGCHFSNLSANKVTLTNIPPGTYTLTISTNTSIQGSSASVSYTFPITNTTVNGNEYFYESFEESSYGVTSDNAIGERYHLGDYTVPFTKPNSKNYIIDYKYILNGKIYSLSKNYNNNMTLTEGEAIDEVRVYPAGAMMTTYTYKPLVGITSKTSPDNKTEFYTYDGFQRLKDILDFDNNIIQNHQYHYKP